MDTGSSLEPTSASPTEKEPRELTRNEWGPAILVESILILQWEMLTGADTRPTRTPCGHDRPNVCLPLFGPKLEQQLRTTVRQISRLMPFPSLSVGEMTGGPKVQLKGQITTLERAVNRIPSERQLQANATALLQGCEPIHAQEMAGRALRLKRACEILLACLYAFYANREPAASGRRSRSSWEDMLRTSYPGSRT